MCKTFMEATILILNSGGLEEIDTLFAGPSVVIIFGGAIGQADGFVEGLLGEDAVDTGQSGERIPVNPRKSQAAEGGDFYNLSGGGEGIAIVHAAERFQNPAVRDSEAAQKT